MAKSKNNLVTHGLSGKIGDMLVFRQIRGETIVSAASEQTSKTASEKQLAHRYRFNKAVIYAKSAKLVPDVQEIYEAAAAKKGKAPFTVAVADFFNAPEIRHIDLSDYTGNTGDVIRIEVTDDVMVKSVQVSIVNADGSIVEEGDAVAANSLGYVWIYTATQVNDNLDGDKITVSVTDLPENVTTEEVTK
jgi:hypothetical protein